MSTPTITPARRRVQRRTLLLLSLAQVFSGVGTGAVVSTGSLLAVEPTPRSCSCRPRSRFTPR